MLQGRKTRVGPTCKEIQRSNENQQAEDIQQYVNEEGSEIKWDGDDLEGRHIFVWSHHSDSTRTQSPMDDILFHPIGS